MEHSITMTKMNCWDAKKCGREIGGPPVKEMGVCPAASETRVNGINGGKNGGRACRVLAGTFCGGKVQGSFSSKMNSCMTCDVYKIIRDDEGKNMIGTAQILEKLK